MFPASINTIRVPIAAVLECDSVFQVHVHIQRGGWDAEWEMVHFIRKE